MLEAIVGEFSPPTASPMGMPWDFHEKCRASFEVRAMQATGIVQRCSMKRCSHSVDSVSSHD